MDNRYQVQKFSSSYYNFVKVIGDLFGIYNLEDIHTLTEEKYKDLFEVGKDSSTIFHKMFYDKLHQGWGELQSMYDNFIQYAVAPNYEEDFLYQAFPTIRFHLPNNIAVGAFHNDAEFNHPKGEMNYIIPLTNSDDTASCWLESEPGKKDVEPIPLRIGELVKFNGNELTHGNKKNETGKTRVSMDFRILPISKYNEEEEGESITLKTKFKEGSYYKRFNK